MMKSNQSGSRSKKMACGGTAKKMRKMKSGGHTGMGEMKKKYTARGGGAAKKGLGFSKNG